MTTYLKQKPVKSCEQFHRKTLVKQANGTTYGGDFIESSIRGSNKKILQTTYLLRHWSFQKFSCYWSFHATEYLLRYWSFQKFSCYWSFHATEYLLRYWSFQKLKFSEVFILRKFSCYWVFIMLLIPFYKKSHFCFTIN